MLEYDQNSTFGTVIKIIGVGGGGGNAINTMIENELSGVEFIVVNTDISDLRKSKAKIKLQIGKKNTRGLGTGADPAIGREAALESQEDIRSHLEGADMVFIAAGMGGGTGTGAAPVIASIAREMGILSLGIVTRPFANEGIRRKQNAEDGIRNFKENVDTMIVIPNEKLNEIFSDMLFLEVLKTADNVLYGAAKAVSDIINLSGYINVDFADVKAVMSNMGYALMGTGICEGENRAVNAAKEAITNPLLSDVALDGCSALLINVTTGYDMKMSEFDDVSKVIVNETGENANIITGLIIDEAMTGKISVTIIATGLSPEGDEKLPIPQIHIKDEAQKKEELSNIMSRIKKSDSYSAEINSTKESNYKKNPFSNEKIDLPSFMRNVMD